MSLIIRQRANPLVLITLALYVLCLLAQPAWSQSRGSSLKIYVVPFQSNSIDSDLLSSLTEDLEMVLAGSEQYQMLERNRLGDLKQELRNESNLRNDVRREKALVLSGGKSRPG